MDPLQPDLPDNLQDSAADSLHEVRSGDVRHSFVGRRAGHAGCVEDIMTLAERLERVMTAAVVETQWWRDACCEPGGEIRFGRERHGAEAVLAAIRKVMDR